jgi:hypothetical protein
MKMEMRSPKPWIVARYEVFGDTLLFTYYPGLKNAADGHVPHSFKASTKDQMILRFCRRKP